MFLHLSMSYSSIFTFLALSFIICAILFFLTYFFSRKERSFKKTVAYECGFDSFSNQLNFDVHFYLVALLFLIFDVEIIFLYP
jgi:NADH-quinone oxidoreductase subunit A